MQNNEYFTPEIEDLHIGYVCEYLEKSVELKFVKAILDKKLLSLILRDYDKIDDWLENSIKTPYLTKEQIENEGWVFVRQQDDFNQVYNKTIKDSDYTLYYYKNYTSKEQEITIEINFKKINQSNKLISGALCRDINTLRKIQKILKLE